MTCKSLASAELAFDPSFKVNRGHHTKKLFHLPYYWFYGLPYVNATKRKSWPSNLLQVSNFTFDLCFKAELGHCTKKSLELLLGLQNMKITYKKLWPVNLLQVSNLTPASRSSEIIIQKRLYPSYILVLGLKPTP